MRASEVGAGLRLRSVKGPDRPRPFAPTGAGGSPLLLGSEGLAPLSEQKEARPWRPPSSTSKHASPQKARE
jgi:hypothetical protein